MPAFQPMGVENLMTDERFILSEISRFRASKEYKEKKTGMDYYVGEHDILKRKREVIGDDGHLHEVDNLPNSRLVDNQYRKMVTQKVNYLLGNPITFQTEKAEYLKSISNIFNKKFQKLMKNIGKDALNTAIGWLYVYYDEDGALSFKKFEPLECIPEWQDREHMVLDYVIRAYDVVHYKSTTETEIITMVEVYGFDGIDYYQTDSSLEKLQPVEPYHTSYFTMGNESYNWERIPIIPFKYNEEETPLIVSVKSLQDALNLILSNFDNDMDSIQGSIMVLINYDGQDLGQFRQNLATYRAVKVRSIDGISGDLKTLQVEVNAENYRLIVSLIKKAIIENAMGYDAKDDRLSGSPNQMNILSMYSDIDLDANGMESEFQASFEELLWFVDCHLANTGQGDYFNEPVEVIFDRDMMMNETEIIQNINASAEILSEETRLANHPWVKNVQLEMDRKKKEQEESDPYAEAFQAMKALNTQKEVMAQDEDK